MHRANTTHRCGLACHCHCSASRTRFELVGGGRHLRGNVRPATSGLRNVAHRLTCAVAVRVPADHGPVVAPGHRLEVHDPAVGAEVLEVQEPDSPAGGVDPGALVRAVDVGARPARGRSALRTGRRLCRERNTDCQPCFTPPAGAKM